VFVCFVTYCNSSNVTLLFIIVNALNKKIFPNNRPYGILNHLWYYYFYNTLPKYYTDPKLDQLIKEDVNMDILNKVKAWAGALTEAGVSLLSLGIVLEVLFNGQNIPFWPNINIIGNIQNIVAGFSAQGLVGLVAVWVLYSIYNRK
jgi:hypothetical protein